MSEEERTRATATVDLSALRENPRSLFLRMSEVDLLAQLSDAGAEISTPVPSVEKIREGLKEPGSKSKSATFPEGYLLATQGQDLSHVFLTLSGSMVYFTGDINSERPISSGLQEDLNAPQILDKLNNSVCDLVTLNHLYYRCKFLGVMWNTQIAGLLEAGLTRVRSQVSSFPRSRNCWLSSVFLSASSVVIRIPIDSFRPLLKSRKLVDIEGQGPQEIGSFLSFRSFEVLAQRYARTLSNTVLRANKEHDYLLAYLLSEFHKGTGNVKIWGTRFKIAFYLGVEDSEVAAITAKLAAIKKGSETALTLPKNRNAQVYLLTPSLLQAHYEQAFALKKR